MTVKRKVVESSLQMSSLSNPSSRLSFEDFAPVSHLYELYFNRSAKVPLREDGSGRERGMHSSSKANKKMTRLQKEEQGRKRL